MMKLNKWLEHARYLVRVVEKDACVTVEIKYEDLVQELAWFEELHEYRDAGYTPEEVKKFAHERTGCWLEVIKPADGLFGLYQAYRKCSRCTREIIGGLPTEDKYCCYCGAWMRNGGKEDET